MKFIKEITKEEYGDLSDEFLKMSKSFRKVKSLMDDKQIKFIEKSLKDIADTLLYNTEKYPEMKDFRVELIRRSLKPSLGLDGQKQVNTKEEVRD